MNDARCWAVVASMGPGLETARLSMMLNALDPDDLGAFCRWLDQVEAALATPDHHDQSLFAYELPRLAEVERPWPTPDEPRPVDFKDLQATVVAHGKDAWQVVAAVPALLAGGWPTGLGRQFLLTVATAGRRSFPDHDPA